MIHGGPVRVLVVVDRRLIAETVQLTLHHAAYETRAATSVREAARLLGEWRPLLAIVDVDLGGASMLRQIGLPPGGRGTAIPVLALTRQGDLATKLAAFAQGVDDIMTLPLSPEELLARVLVLTRRTYGELAPVRPVLTQRDLEIDLLTRQVRVGTSVLHLTGLELSLLYLLAANAGTVVTRDEILDELWGPDYVGESNVIDRHIRSLRAKLQDNWRQPRLIATVPGRGYRFLPQLAEAAREGASSPPDSSSRGAMTERS